MNVLECDGLSAARIAGSPCVHEVDLKVGKGEVIALLGPNGAGKTTMLETLAGLLPREAGKVVVGGVELPSGNPRSAVRNGLVLVPDDRALFRRLTTEQNMRLAVKSRGRKAAAQEMEVALEYFPALRKRMSVAAGQLSGGEQQMLALARALLQKPDVLLIDELSMGLAPVIVEAILPVLRQVAADQGTSVILVEQHVHLALGIADRAVVLVKGRIHLEDDASALAADLGRLEAAYMGE
ncbi:ABC transporter ATP-binding protein [Gordonia neofelifaecis]|uniref:Putative ABC transporter ATP-binding protein n=1 Tax=Gordonia neofelifaecis NRRL B-59395 TaxID=644548 RepID=F1YM65_9ACTN|nr:ABC transporter ATP-binding protein [Gordonia neofelifaecis]EGD54316.1 putative ABC transporter ATP-binding protein [Gordonia neofelifaecis NRRL B-59395]